MTEVYFVLVEPSVPENIGAAARAIKTMGFTNLRLVNPTKHLSNKARWLAHGSFEILQNARTYPSLEEAIQDLDFNIGTTAKNRSVKKDYHHPSHLAGLIEKKEATISKIGVIFGREESGLSNEELALCDIASTVPLAAPYPSINLAQSVMIYAYELSKLAIVPAPSAHNSAQPEAFKVMKNNISRFLEDTDMVKSPVLLNRVVERISQASADDLHLIMSVIKNIDKKSTS